MEIVPFNRPAAKAVSEHLADLIKEVESGEVETLAYAVILRDKSIVAGWTGPTVAQCLGAVTRLQYRINVAMDV